MSRSVEEAMRVLGVADSDPETVAHAYRRLAQGHPPRRVAQIRTPQTGSPPVAAAYRLPAACEPEPTEVRAHAAVPVRPGLAPVSGPATDWEAWLDGDVGGIALRTPHTLERSGLSWPAPWRSSGGTDQTEHPRSRKGETGDCRPGGRPRSVLHRSRLRDHRGQSADAAHLRAERSAVALPHPGQDTPATAVTTWIASPRSRPC